MKVQIECTLPFSAEAVWQALQQSSTLVHVARSRVQFDTRTFPRYWVEGQQIDTTVYRAGDPDDLGMDYHFVFDEIDHDAMVMHTREWGGPIKYWLHTYEVIPGDDHSCTLTNHFDISGGWKFWVTLYLAWYFIPKYYTERHQRLHELLASG